MQKTIKLNLSGADPVHGPLRYELQKEADTYRLKVTDEDGCEAITEPLPDDLAQLIERTDPSWVSKESAHRSN